MTNTVTMSALAFVLAAQNADVVVDGATIMLIPNRMQCYYGARIATEYAKGVSVGDALMSPARDVYTAGRYIMCAPNQRDMIERGVEVALDVAIVNGASIPANFNSAVISGYADDKTKKYKEQIEKDAKTKIGWLPSSRAKAAVNEAKRDSSFNRPSGGTTFYVTKNNSKGPPNGVGGMHVQIGSASRKSEFNFSPDLQVNVDSPTRNTNVDKSRPIFSKKFYGPSGGNGGAFIHFESDEYVVEVPTDRKSLTVDMNHYQTEAPSLFALTYISIILVGRSRRHISYVFSVKGMEVAYPMSTYGSICDDVYHEI